MKKNEKETYLIPMEVTRETIKDYSIKKEDVVPAKIGNKIVSAIMVPATKEQYEAYMRPIWAEMKREERARRCMISNGNGKLKRCEKDCKSCEKMKDGAPLSLDSFYEETELEFEELSANQLDIIITDFFLDDLIEMLHQQNPDFAVIFKMLYDEKTQREIAKLIDKPQTTVNYMIKCIRKILQQHVDREDL